MILSAVIWVQYRTEEVGHGDFIWTSDSFCGNGDGRRLRLSAQKVNTSYSTESPAGVCPGRCRSFAGVCFLLLLDRSVPHLHLGSETYEGPDSALKRTP